MLLPDDNTAKSRIGHLLGESLGFHHFPFVDICPFNTPNCICDPRGNTLAWSMVTISTGAFMGPLSEMLGNSMNRDVRLCSLCSNSSIPNGLIDFGVSKSRNHTVSFYDNAQRLRTLICCGFNAVVWCSYTTSFTYVFCGNDEPSSIRSLDNHCCQLITAHSKQKAEDGQIQM